MFKRLFADLRAALTGKSETPQAHAIGPPESGRVGAKSVSASSGPSGWDRNPSGERVAVHAYYRWLSRGKPVGSDWEDWFEAERQLQPTASA